MSNVFVNESYNPAAQPCCLMVHHPIQSSSPLTMHRFSLLTVLPFLIITTSLAPAQDAPFDQTHAAFTSVLQQQVKNERVNYAALKKNPEALGGYLVTLAAVKEAEFKGWSTDQRLAFLINLYNAATLKLVVDHYPVKSIKDIGSLFKGPWDQSVVKVFGQDVTLNHIEHDIIRAKLSIKYTDYNWALNKQ
jgi:hypothetical protein